MSIDYLSHTAHQLVAEVLHDLAKHLQQAQRITRDQHQHQQH
jgi:hypothetical protein